MLFPKSSVDDERHLAHDRACAARPATNTSSRTCSCRTATRCSATTPADRREDGPLYRFTSSQLYSAGFAGVGLGIARGTIDAFLDLPATKVSRGACKPMRENNVVQSQFAQSEARWHSARAFLHTTLDELYGPRRGSMAR